MCGTDLSVHSDVVVSLNCHREGNWIKYNELRRQYSRTVARRRAAAHWDGCLGRRDSRYNSSRVDEIVREGREVIIAIVHDFHCEHIKRHEPIGCICNNLQKTQRGEGGRKETN